MDAKKLKFWWYRFRYHYGRYLPLRAPVDVSLELSSFCNMHCGHCYHADKKNLPFKQKFMPFETACNILRSAADAGVDSVKLNWRGESTMHPRFGDIAAYAKALGFKERLTNSNFKFNTNSVHIFRGLACQTKVKVSLDSMRKEVFERQRAGGDFDLTTANLATFYHWPNRTTEIVVQAVRSKLNADEDIEGAVKKRWPGIGYSERDMVEGRVEKDLTASVCRSRGEARQPCRQAFVRLIFNADGVASPCCPDIKSELKLGSIDSASVREIFQSELARKLRVDLKSGNAFDLNPCRTCSSYESYAGYKASWGS